ncbi:MAG: YraN family protein [Candidatus Omnitrophica bacterium]|nr:YraN family protein [Candidatus Omnitrophota bacterium]
MEWLKRPCTFAERLSRSAKVGSHSRPWCMRSHGALGEKLAEEFLKRNGYKILARRFLCRFGELDIVAQDSEAIVFVEVKLKASSEFGMPYEAIDRRKQARIVRSAMAFIKRHRLEDYDFRFDVVSILSKEGTKPQIELIKDAFDEGVIRCWQR